MLDGPIQLLTLVSALCAVAVILFQAVHSPVRGLYVAIFASSILIAPTLPFVQDRFTATEIVMLITWGASITAPSAWSRFSQLTREQRRVLGAAAALVCIGIISACWNSIEAGWPHIVVFELVTYVYCLMLMTTVVLLVDTWEKWWNCIKAWLLGAAIVSGVAVYSLVFSPPSWAIDDTARIASTMQWENQIPSQVVTMMGIAIVAAGLPWLGKLWRVFYACVAFGSIVAVLGSGSRTGFGMVVLCLLGTFMAGSGANRNGQATPQMHRAIGLLLFGGLTAFIVMVLTSGREYEGLTKTAPYERAILMTADMAEGEAGIGKRERQLKVGLRTAVRNMLIGVGPGRSGRVNDMNRVHNTYVAVVAETGIFGLVVLFGWLGGAGYCAWSARRRLSPRQQLVVDAFLAGFVALLAYQCFMFGLRQRSLWFCAGLLVALPRVARDYRRHVGMAEQKSRAFNCQAFDNEAHRRISAPVSHP